MSSSSEEKISFDHENISNGLLLLNHYLPEELLVSVLVYVNWKDLMSCRLVCRSWRRLIDSIVCCRKLNMFSLKTLNESFTDPLPKLKSDCVPFYLYFHISEGVFGKNLLNNAFGSGDNPHVCQRNRNALGRYERLRRNRFRNRDQGTVYFNNFLCLDKDCPKFKHWMVLESGGSGWCVENEPNGSEPLPAHLPERSCFITSNDWCKKEQIITLAKCGIGAKVMDEIQPQIDISDWYARHRDCGMIYELNVKLLNSEKEIVQRFMEWRGKDLDDSAWHEISYRFKNYGPGVRYIQFIHAGRDRQGGAGHYGSKIAGSSVILRLPISEFQRSSETPSC